MENNPLEFLARSFENVVKYDADGNPSIFVKFPKMKSSELDSNLPDHTHPAFIINGVEQDYILIGKYLGSTLSGNTGTIYSLPNMPPVINRTDEQMLQQARAFGDRVSGMTIADRAFMTLLALKMGWNPKGNGTYGADIDKGTPYMYASGTIEAGTEFVYRGRIIRCKVTHTQSEATTPDKSSGYWEWGRRVGGIEATNVRADVGNAKNTTLTLTGSGPKEWYLNGQLDSVADFVGNQAETVYGARLGPYGQIQIIENNDAADPNTDISANSAKWKAIRPNAADTGYMLVPPSTGGTLYFRPGTGGESPLVLDTHKGTGSQTEYAVPCGTFRDIGKSPVLVHIPTILKELCLFPLTNRPIGQSGNIHFQYSENILPVRFGADFRANNLGLCNIVFGEEEGSNGMFYGIRPRAMP